MNIRIRLIPEESGLIADESGLIADESGLIPEDSGLIPEESDQHLHCLLFCLQFLWHLSEIKLLCSEFKVITTKLCGVQRRMISMDNCFIFLRLLFFAFLLLYVT